MRTLYAIMAMSEQSIEEYTEEMPLGDGRILALKIILTPPTGAQEQPLP